MPATLSSSLADSNVAKSSVSKWANEYREEWLYTTDTTSESNDAKEIRRLNQLLNEKDAKREYHKRLEHIFELIKYVYYNNNRVIGYRAMRIFIKRYGYELSNTTMHKYMNKELNLCAVIMHSKLGYKTGKKKTTLKWFCTQIREYSLPHGILWISVKIIM